MDDDLELLLREVAEVVLEQGGDDDAVFAVLADRYPGVPLMIPDGSVRARAEALAVGLLVTYREPGEGPRLLQARVDRRADLVAPTRVSRWRRRRAG